jgi:hypothetical protein
MSFLLNKGKTPPLSLANHLLLGDVPAELRDWTPVEESVVARCRAKVCIIQLKAEDGITLSNTQRGLRGHIVIYPQKPENLLNILPPSVEDVCTPICVVFVGSHRPTHAWLRENAKPLIVRRERIRSALLWLKNHNDLYRHVLINENCLNMYPAHDVLPVHIEVIRKEDTADVLTSRYDDPQGDTSADNNTNSADSSIPNLVHPEPIFDSIVVAELTGEATVNQMRAAAIMHMKSKGRRLSSNSSRRTTRQRILQSPPSSINLSHSFPMWNRWFRRLAAPHFTILQTSSQTLADRRFQEHYSFLFTIFNILQRRAIL